MGGANVLIWVFPCGGINAVQETLFSVNCYINQNSKAMFSIYVQFSIF